ncbi:MAG: hypothetical protein H6639_17835 [Caldilineaceae bacterium]|nr:hypothetical protein [Caldilinea sp.]MCB9116807.1 hypothetical protein [Caldilineaceae bacterium]
MRTERLFIALTLVMAAVLLMAAPAGALPAQQGSTDCPWGYPVYDPATHTYVSPCSSGYGTPAPAVDNPLPTGQDSIYGCPWGYPVYDPATHTFVPPC